MNLPETTSLYFAPDDLLVNAQIVLLTPELYETGMRQIWWDDSDVEKSSMSAAIDLHWSWFDPVDLDGIALPAVRVVIVTGDGQVQGAMVVSTALVQSMLNPEQQCLYVDQLCTAPRNRPLLRLDRGPWFKGVGTKLLQWASRLSVEAGGEGKLHLLASPEGQQSYQKLGFENLKLASRRHDDIKYQPMELSLNAVPEFLER